MITVLGGGVGAARFLRGLVQVVDPRDITAIVNTADDTEMHGLAISPDLDTVTYTLAGAIDPERGWGLAGETWAAMDALKRYEAARPAGSTAGGTWFGLGDQDLATHLYRTQRRAEGAPLSTVTAEIAASWGLGVHLLPMSDQPVRTRVTLAEGGELGFQEYFVGRAHDVAISGVRFDGLDAAVPGPGVLESLYDATVIVIAPSNPIVSIGPILAVGGVRDLLVSRRRSVVAVSPIVGGRALKGPADRMLRELGMASDAVGVARAYRDVAATLVLDTVDAGLAAAVEAEGVRGVVTDTVMATPAVAASLARATVEAVEPPVSRLQIWGIDGIGEIRPGDVLAEVIASAAAQPPGGPLLDGDVVVVTQKIVSKAEGRLVAVDPDDPRSHKGVVEAEAVRVLRRRGDLVITETTHGFVCANSGVDLSNVERGYAALLPLDSDRSARRIRDGLRGRLGVEVGVIVSDTFGRAWRRGLTDVAIGVAGIAAVVDLRGTADALGRVMQVTEVAVADELAGAAELVMGKSSGMPVAVVRGVDGDWLRDASIAELVRPPQEDLFR